MYKTFATDRLADKTPSNKKHDCAHSKFNLFASWIVNELLITGMKRLTRIYWIQNNFVSNNNLTKKNYSILFTKIALIMSVYNEVIQVDFTIQTFNSNDIY